MSPQPDNQILKTAVPCPTVLEKAGWQTEDHPGRDKMIWRERNAPPDAPSIVTTHGGQGFFVQGTQTKGDVFDLAGYLDPTLTSFPARRAKIAGMASPADIEQARATMPPDTGEDARRSSYSRLWVTHHPLKEGSPAYSWLTEARGIHPIVVQAAMAQEELREGPNATVWAKHRTAAGDMTGWDAEGPDFRNFASGATRSLFTLDAANGGATRIVVADTPIEAMSIATIERMRGDTIYAAVSGAVGLETTTTLRAYIDRIDPYKLSIVVATPTTDAGNSLAERIAAVGHAANFVPDRIFPSHGQKDFNAMITRETITRGPENDGAAAVRPTPAAPVSPNIEIVERGKPRAINDETKLSVDIGKSDAGYHYKSVITLNGRDLPGSEWSQAFESRKEARETAAFSAGRDLERAIAANAGGKASASSSSNPYQQVLDEIGKSVANLPDTGENRKLSQRVNDLFERSKQPGALNDMATQQEIAWAMADTERATGIRTNVSDQIRDQLLTLAVSIQGLNDPSVVRLMKYTNRLDSQDTVDQIRDFAVRIAPNKAPQVGSGDKLLLDRLEQRVLDESLNQPTQRQSLSRDQSVEAQQSARLTQQNRQYQTVEARAQNAPTPTETAGASAGQGTTQRPVVQATTANVKVTPGASTGPGWLEGIANRVKQSPLFSGPAPRASNSNGADPTATNDPAAAPAPTQPAPYADTSFDHKGAVAGIERDLIVEGVTAAAVTAAQAMTSLRQMMGGIGQKIDAAAENDPGGYANVISGMKPGGQYAELRSELDAQIQQSQGFAGTYQQATDALQNYSTNRVSAEQWFRNNAMKVSELDKDLAPAEKGLFESLQKTPGLTSGLSMLDEMATKFGEAIMQIIDRARTALGFGPGVSNDPSPSPAGPQNEQRPGPRPG